MEILHYVMATNKVLNANFKGLMMDNVHVNASNKIYGDGDQYVKGHLSMHLSFPLVF
jgi:hypothetical protein